MASKSPAFALLPLITPYRRSTPGGGQSRKSRASPDSQMDLKPQRLGPRRQQEMKAAGCCWCKTVPPQMQHALESLPPLTTTVGKWRGLVAVSNGGQWCTGRDWEGQEVSMILQEWQSLIRFYLGVGLNLVQEPVTQGHCITAKAPPRVLWMGNVILIMVFLPGKRTKRPPVPQRSCLKTHQRVIKLKSTDVVGWDVSCSQRLRNLSDNSTFICREDKKTKRMSVHFTDTNWTSQLDSKLTY